jgi:hypothetical protein
MNSSQHGSGWFGVKARGSAVTLLLALATTPILPGQSVSAAGGWHQIDLSQYRQHLQELVGVVAGCQAQLALKRPVPSADNVCDPNSVGQDDRVSGAVAGDSQPRDVRYDWLRTVLARASNKTPAPAPDTIGLIPGSKSQLPTIDAQLTQALERVKRRESSFQPSTHGPGL